MYVICSAWPAISPGCAQSVTVVVVSVTVNNMADAGFTVVSASGQE